MSPESTILDDPEIKTAIHKARIGVITEKRLVAAIKGTVDRLRENTFSQCHIFDIKTDVWNDIKAAITYRGQISNIDFNALLTASIRLHIVIKKLRDLYKNGIKEAHKAHKLDVKFKDIITEILRVEEKAAQQLAKKYGLKTHSVQGIRVEFRKLKKDRRNSEAQKKLQEIQLQIAEEYKVLQYEKFADKINKRLKANFQRLKKNANTQGKHIDIILGLARTLADSKIKLSSISDRKEQDRIRRLKANVGTMLPDAVRTIRENFAALYKMMIEEKDLLTTDTKLEFKDQEFTEKMDELVTRELHENFDTLRVKA